MAGNRSLRTLGLAAASLALVLGGTAHADLTDVDDATIQNTLEYVSKASPLTTNPNISCSLEAVGGVINQHTNAGVLDVTAQDYAEAQVTCVNIDRTAPAFTINGWLQVEHFIKPGFIGAGTWSPTSKCKSGVASATSVNGVAIIPLLSVLCQWPALEPAGGGTYMASPYLNTFHRGHVFVTSTSFAKKDKPTPSIWWMNP